MVEPRPLLADERVEKAMGALLRGGVILAGLIVLAGGIAYLAGHGGARGDTSRVFRGEAPPPMEPDADTGKLRSLWGTVGLALSGDSRGIMQLGLLVLVATPVARVLFSFLVFLVQRDRTYVFITLLVLGVLVYSLAAGE